MVLLLVFAATLLAAVLISGVAERTVLSTAVLFLVAGFVAGSTGLLPLKPEDPLEVRLAELALFVVLFTDGMRVGLGDLASAWRLPGRALVLGLPLTLLLTALLAHYVAGLPWAEAFLIGAVLSPTDPVFASALVGREEVPRRLRHLLNVESGLNDGLALPLVLVLLALSPPRGEIEALALLGELALGVGIGVVVPYVALRLERTKPFDLAPRYEPLYAFAVGLLVLALAYVTHANLFLAAFAAGITTASVSPRAREAFHGFGELLTELLKLAAILAFGALISPAFLGEIGPGGYVFALLALFLVRPLALLFSFLGAHIGRREFLAAAWFGPKGFASVVYGLLVLQSGIVRADEAFHLISLVVVASILLHSSTDVVVARRFRDADLGEPT